MKKMTKGRAMGTWRRQNTESTDCMAVLATTHVRVAETLGWWLVVLMKPPSL
jgi:hypothetical protein